MLRARFAVAVLLAALLLGAPAAVFAAALAPTESYAQLVKQIDSGKVVLATVNRFRHDVKVTLADGTVQRASYPPTLRRHLVDTLVRHGVHPSYALRPHTKKATHHVLRYVAAAVVVVLLLVGIGIWFYTRRATPAPGASAATDPGDVTQ
jgi:hypothetical protein